MIDLGKLPGALRGLAYTLKKYEVAKSPSHSGNRDWLGPLLWLEIESFLINIGYEPEARGDEPLGVVGFQNIMMQAIKQKGGDEKNRVRRELDRVMEAMYKTQTKGRG